jgi:hypothetical protein
MLCVLMDVHVEHAGMVVVVEGMYLLTQFPPAWQSVPKGQHLPPRVAGQRYRLVWGQTLPQQPEAVELPVVMVVRTLVQ